MNFIAGLIAKKAAGKLVGMIVSKTVQAGTAGSLAGLWPLIPQILEKDPQAIGNGLLIIVAWLGVIIGRMKAAK